MKIATPVDAAGNSATAWGRAHWIAVADVQHEHIADWQVHEVSWDVLHDSGGHGAHHARVVRFLLDNDIDGIVVDHVGEGMRRMLHRMRIPMLPATPGDAQASVLEAVLHATTPAGD
ncbi:NifB/NifX family molybdenum-iron cluster-binding protein [Propionicicella superfundia]|uniref:NifB/NifX family molybdenum-iron cluster-binding protein n=1 Tax=Propionicicella superfundia TaxID=348582 RepID=UPI0003FEB0C2|nr:NifB/NifX family molybdenum-iron cluster-binding protein [Propionicicella superfundia]